MRSYILHMRIYMWSAYKSGGTNKAAVLIYTAGHIMPLLITPPVIINAAAYISGGVSLTFSAKKHKM